MFEVGFTEILLIAALALLVLGPEKLPRLAERLGYLAGRARFMARQFHTQLEQEVRYEELMKEHPTPTSTATPDPQRPAPPQQASPNATDEHSQSGPSA